MTERTCGYTLVVWIFGERREISCNPEDFCLRELIWSGKGMRGAGSLVLNVPPATITQGKTEGSCKFSPLKE
ncbi:MAG TPA: hypothetical protein VJ227_04660 [Patescibacteria group bacterium]|nr:hypothetical protein [Patescibacteria group bacterium]